MKEAILSLHRRHNPPAPYILNESQYQIDGIWYSIGLTATKAGTPILDKGFHRTIEYWGKNSYSKMYLGQKTKLRNKSQYWKQVNQETLKHISIEQKKLQNNKCLQKLQTLHTILKERSTNVYQQKYDKILQLITIIRKIKKEFTSHLQRRNIVVTEVQTRQRHQKTFKPTPQI